MATCPHLTRLVLGGFNHQLDLGTLGGAERLPGSSAPIHTEESRDAWLPRRDAPRAPLWLKLRFCRGLDVSLLTRCPPLTTLEVMDCCCLTGFVPLINCPRLTRLIWGKSSLIEWHDSVCTDGLRLLAHQVKQTLSSLVISPEVPEDLHAEYDLDPPDDESEAVADRADSVGLSEVVVADGAVLADFNGACDEPS